MNKDIKYKEISIESFSPRLLRSSLYSEGRNLPQGYGLGERYVYDYELEFFIYSKGNMVIEGTTYPVSKDDIVFRKPGELVEGIMPYSCYLLCFDLLGNTNKDSLTYELSNQCTFQTHYVNEFLDSIPSVFHPKSGDIYLKLFDDILSEYINPSLGSSLIVKSNILKIFYEMQKEILSPTMNNTSFFNSPHFNKLKYSLDFIIRNSDKKITLLDIASVTNLSPTYFHKIFTENFKITPNNYLNKIRLNKAKELLVKTSTPINQIALDCGFDNIPYFSTIFKSNFNMSPIDFRKKYTYY